MRLKFANRDQYENGSFELLDTKNLREELDSMNSWVRPESIIGLLRFSMSIVKGEKENEHKGVPRGPSKPKSAKIKRNQVKLAPLSVDH